MRLIHLLRLVSAVFVLVGSSAATAQTKYAYAPPEKATLCGKNVCAVEPKCAAESSCGIAPCGTDGWGILDPFRFAPSWELFPQTCSGWDIGGWIQMGYHTEGANDFGTGLFNTYPNVVQLQQAWMYLEKEADTGGCGWDWGFRFDYVYGTDGIDTQAYGSEPGDWDRTWNAGGHYGHAFPQLYAEVAYNDLKVKVGHFYTIMGYEVVPAPDNFFYSHAYTMTLAEPFTHTGALAEWAPCEGLTFYGGWTQGWDTGYSDYHGATFLGGVSAELIDGLSVTYTTTMGDFGFGPGGSDSNGYSHSVVVDWSITDRVNYVFQTDYVDNRLLVGNAIGAPNTGKTWGINQYLLYTVNDCWAFGSRFEWFSFGGYEMSEFTLGMNISPHSNLVIRPEVRLDAFEPGVLTLLGLQDSTVFGIDAIITF